MKFMNNHLSKYWPDLDNKRTDANNPYGVVAELELIMIVPFIRKLPGNNIVYAHSDVICNVCLFSHNLFTTFLSVDVRWQACHRTLLREGTWNLISC